MKLKLSSSLKTLILQITAVLVYMALPAFADYTGGQIANTSDLNAGTPLYSGDITIDYNDAKSEFSGAVELSGVEGSNKTITLEGNINIKAGYDYINEEASDTSPRNGAVMIGNSGSNAIAEGAPVSDATVILRTVNADDQIVLDAYGPNTRTVLVASNVDGAGAARLVLDASSSTKDIVIRQGSAYEKGGGALTTVGNGTIDVKGNLDISTTANTAMGIWLRGHANNYTVDHSLYVEGNTKINSNGEGVRMETGAKAVFNGDLTAKARTMAVRLSGFGALMLLGNLDARITEDPGTGTNAAVYVSNNSTMLMSGATNISSASGRTWAIYAGDGSVIKSVVENEFYQYNINGLVRSSGEGAVIDLKLGGNSLFVGATELAGTGNRVLNLSLKDSANWVLTSTNKAAAAFWETSQLTNLDLYEGATITFTLDDNGNFRNINALSVSLMEGSILKLDADSDYFSSLLLADSGSIDVALFNNDASIIGTGTLVTKDNFILEFQKTNGTYSITGVTDVQIPEPATATLGLLPLAALIIRRRK